MKLLIITSIFISLIIGYFFIGMILSFLASYWICIIGIPLMLFIAFSFGWIGAICGCIGILIVIGINNEWHSNEKYLKAIDWIEKKFFLND